MRGRPRKEVAVIHNRLARAQSDLSPLGMRIMVLLATRVSHDHDLLKHRLKVQEYKARLGLTGGSAYNTLEEVADEMLKSLVEVEDFLEGSRTKFQILSKAKYYERDGTIELQFHQDMRPFLVDIREHFTQIPTDVFLRLRSGYAMKMYMQVRSWNPNDIRNKSPNWKMDIDQVRWFFRLAHGEYKEPKHIAAAVLKRAMRELNERADVTFRYEPIKEHRKISGWHFRAIPNTPTITLPAGAAAAKRRQEQLEEAEYAKATRASTERFEWVKERWLSADGDDRNRWLLAMPELHRRVDPLSPGILFLTALCDVIAKEQSPGLPGLTQLMDGV
jgi:plasmid replication initiation protein